MRRDKAVLDDKGVLRRGLVVRGCGWTIYPLKPAQAQASGAAFPMHWGRFEPLRRLKSRHVNRRGRPRRIRLDSPWSTNTRTAKRRSMRTLARRGPDRGSTRGRNRRSSQLDVKRDAVTTLVLS